MSRQKNPPGSNRPLHLQWSTRAALNVYMFNSRMYVGKLHDAVYKISPIRYTVKSDCANELLQLNIFTT